MLAILFGLLGIFSTNGFSETPKAFSVSDTIRLNKKKVNYDTSHYLIVNRIFIIGNNKTRDQIILRELSLHQGDVVDSAELILILERDKRKLYNTRLFNRTDVRTLEFEPGRIDILVDVNERWYTFPTPRFELSDRNFNEWWENYNHDINRVVYGIKLYQYNMRGRNETLLVTALLGFQRKLSLIYRIPYLNKKQKQGLIFDFDFTEAKNVAYRTVDHKLVYEKLRTLQKYSTLTGLTYTYRNSFYQTHSLRAEYSTAWISDSILIKNENYFGPGRRRQYYGGLTYTFLSEHRDVIAYPLNGYQTLAIVSKTGLGLGDDLNKFEINVSLSNFKDLKRGFYFANYANVYWSTSHGVPYANYSALGYRKQFVKGYETYVIEGPYYFLNKATLKKRIFSRKINWELMPRGFEYIPLSLYLKSYCDLGYVRNYPYYQENNFNTRLSNTLLAGVGGGLDIVASYDVVLRLEYTMNAQGKNGFYFHLKKEF